MRPPSQRPSSQGAAMHWVTQITTGSLLLALPTAGGWWLDSKWGTAPWILITGAFFGSLLSFIHLLAITGVLKQKPRP